MNIQLHPKIILASFKDRAQESKVESKDPPQKHLYDTTLQSKMNTKLSLHRFWPCHENGLIKTIQTIPHNLYVSFKLTSLYYGLWIILVYPYPH